MNIQQATIKALRGQGKMTRANALWAFSYLNIMELPIQLVSERNAEGKCWNPTAEDLEADDWQAI